MRYGLWSADQGSSLTFIPMDAYEEVLQQGILETDAQLIWTVEADSWEVASALYHEYMGWESYQERNE